MKNYILTIFGQFESEKDCKEMAIALTPIVDSPNLKFQHTKGTLIFHFKSEVLKEEIFDYVRGVLFGITDAFILTELHDNMTLSMPQDIKEHLLDLENNSSDVNMFIDMKLEKKNLNSIEEDEDDFVALLLEELKSQVKKPSLDYILDKILDKGYDSLTEHEKKTLKNYSEN